MNSHGQFDREYAVYCSQCGDLSNTQIIRQIKSQSRESGSISHGITLGIEAIHINLCNQNLNELTFMPISKALVKIGPNVLSLDLSFNLLFKDCCVTHLESVLRANNGLEYITIEKTGISEAGACSLIRALAGIPTLRSLNIASNKLSERFFERLGTLFSEGRMSSMEALNLSNTKMSEKSAVSLFVPLIENSHVEKLNLSMNCLRYKAGSCLLTLLTTQPRAALKYVDLTYNSISKSLLQAIEAELFKRQHDANKTLSDQVELSGINPICESAGPVHTPDVQSREQQREQEASSGAELALLIDNMPAAGNKENAETTQFEASGKEVTVPDTRSMCEEEAYNILREKALNHFLVANRKPCEAEKKASSSSQQRSMDQCCTFHENPAEPRAQPQEVVDVDQSEPQPTEEELAQFRQMADSGSRQKRGSPLKATASFQSLGSEEAGSGSYEDMRSKIMHNKNSAQALHPFYAHMRRPESEASDSAADTFETQQPAPPQQQQQTVIVEELEEDTLSTKNALHQQLQARPDQEEQHDENEEEAEHEPEQNPGKTDNEDEGGYKSPNSTSTAKKVVATREPKDEITELSIPESNENAEGADVSVPRNADTTDCPSSVSAEAMEDPKTDKEKAKEIIREQIRKLLSCYFGIDFGQSPPELILAEAMNLVKCTPATVRAKTPEPGQRLIRRRFSGRPTVARVGSEIRGRFIRKRNVSTNLTQYSSCVSRTTAGSRYDTDCEAGKGMIEGGAEAQVYSQIVSGRNDYPRLTPKRFCHPVNN